MKGYNDIGVIWERLVDANFGLETFQQDVIHALHVELLITVNKLHGGRMISKENANTFMAQTQPSTTQPYTEAVDPPVSANRSLTYTNHKKHINYRKAKIRKSKGWYLNVFGIYNNIRGSFVSVLFCNLANLKMAEYQWKSYGEIEGKEEITLPLEELKLLLHGDDELHRDIVGHVALHGAGSDRLDAILSVDLVQGAADSVL